ncbi:hypothetical protein B0H17DRAFT_1129214 [Mycena rosella]|uniref:Uncharacterized protein n=1 Tax=Mycena rosella TaxID=1033263 RepID=A0AAD7DTU7_MYCRO|nr:hypothetical protein B0H17DRAFT_1129214 [Mycena rosella]
MVCFDLVATSFLGPVPSKSFTHPVSCTHIPPFSVFETRSLLPWHTGDTRNITSSLRNWTPIRKANPLTTTGCVLGPSGCGFLLAWGRVNWSALPLFLGALMHGTYWINTQCNITLLHSSGPPRDVQHPRLAKFSRDCVSAVRHGVAGFIYDVEGPCTGTTGDCGELQYGGIHSIL